MTTRRDSGDGSIFQQADGRWVAMLDLGRRPDGRRHRRKMTGRTKAEVRDKLRAAKAEARLGIAATTSRQTVREYLDWWLANDVPMGKASASTAEGYAEIARLYIVPHIGAVKLSDLSPEHVITMMRALTDAGLSPRTVHHARAVLRRSLHRAEALGRVPRNVAALVESPKQDGHKTDDALTAAEMRAVLVEAKRDGDLFPLAVVLLRLGLRKGEALGLRWADVDLEAGELTVASTIKFPRGGGYLLSLPKTADSLRTIPLPPFEVGVLREHRRAQAELRLASPLWHDGDFVFTTSVGTPIHSRNALRWWHRITTAAAVGRRRMHASRHTTATLLLDAGVPLEVVSAVLGHSSLAITADIYAKVTKDSMRRALATFADHLTPEPRPHGHTESA